MTGTDIEINFRQARILRLFLEQPGDTRYGYEVMQATGMQSGSVYPDLTRLVRIGWLIRAKETIDPRSAKRPARTVYQLTPAGKEDGWAFLAMLSDEIRPPGYRDNPPGPGDAGEYDPGCEADDQGGMSEHTPDWDQVARLEDERCGESSG